MSHCVSEPGPHRHAANIGGPRPDLRTDADHGGDDDLVTIEHQEAMRAAVQHGQLAIVPGTSHGLPLEKTDLVARLIFDFLADQQTPKFMPGPTA
jgi:pimeloyl-ACP methyl ester carboxylesterase